MRNYETSLERTLIKERICNNQTQRVTNTLPERVEARALNSGTGSPLERASPGQPSFSPAKRVTGGI